MNAPDDIEMVSIEKQKRDKLIENELTNREESPEVQN